MSRPMAAVTAATTMRMAPKSSGVRLPGRPASSSSFISFLRASCGVERDSIAPIRSIIGRSRRSLKGFCSSTSSRVSGLSPPYTCRRWATRSAVLAVLAALRANPMNMIRIPMPITVTGSAVAIMPIAWPAMMFVAWPVTEALAIRCTGQ